MPDKNTLSLATNQGTGASELPQYARRVTMISSQLDDIKCSLTTEEFDSLDDVDLSVRLDYVESLYSNFEQAVLLLEEKCEDSIESNIRSKFMTSYFEIKAKIKRKINVHCNSRTAPHSSTVRQFSLDESTSARKTRLPELKIPTFSGSYTEWPDFFAMFTTVIANDMDMEIKKFQHLRACLIWTQSLRWTPQRRIMTRLSHY